MRDCDMVMMVGRNGGREWTMENGSDLAVHSSSTSLVTLATQSGGKFSTRSREPPPYLSTSKREHQKLFRRGSGALTYPHYCIDIEAK